MIEVKTQSFSYPVYLEKGALARVGDCFPLDRRVMIVTDEGVPKEYADSVFRAAKEAYLFTAPEGEGAKSLPVWEKILREMVKYEFDRHDCVVAVGGGVVGDLAGFAAASYMRGVDFYNVPTTTLAQVDSSIGGKVAVNFEGYKNLVGSFYPPKGVLIDPEVLKTLSPRLISCGLCEAIKMAACFDADLFARFEKHEEILSLIRGALLIKKRVVEEDEKEQGLRKVLNFGHTLAHALENEKGLSLYHGECVALGMLPLCAKDVRERLEKVLFSYSLPTKWEWDVEKTVSAVRHDKKRAGDFVTLITLPEIGRFEMKNTSFDELKTILEKEMAR